MARARVDGWLDPESGAVVRAALDAYCDVAGRAPDESRSRAQVRADALVDVCRFNLEHGDVPVTGGFRPQVTVIVDLETLEGRAGSAQLVVSLGSSASRSKRTIAGARSTAAYVPIRSSDSRSWRRRMPD